MPLTGWLVDLNCDIPCPCHYFNKWGYCVHYVLACEETGKHYPGLNPRAIVLMDTRIKVAERKQKNASKMRALEEKASASTRGTARTRAASRGKKRGKPRGRGGGRGKLVGDAYTFG